MDQNQQQNNQHQPEQPYVAQPLENPGQTLGIVSIIMIFVFPLLGIVFGAMSRNKSKAVGMPSSLGTAGLVINIVVTIIGAILAIILIVFIFAANASGANTNSSNSAGKASIQEAGLSVDAKEVAKRAQAYKLETGDYPKSINDFSKHTQSAIPTNIEVFSSLLLTSKSLTYIYCGQGAAQVVYLGESSEDKRITAVGSASSTEVCPKSY